jgi:hypothetical protein
LFQAFLKCISQRLSFLGHILRLAISEPKLSESEHRNSAISGFGSEVSSRGQRRRIDSSYDHDFARRFPGKTSARHSEKSAYAGDEESFFFIFHRKIPRSIRRPKHYNAVPVLQPAAEPENISAEGHR